MPKPHSDYLCHFVVQHGFVTCCSIPVCGPDVDQKFLVHVEHTPGQACCVALKRLCRRGLCGRFAISHKSVVSRVQETALEQRPKTGRGLLWTKTWTTPLAWTFFGLFLRPFCGLGRAAATAAPPARCPGRLGPTAQAAQSRFCFGCGTSSFVMGSDARTGFQAQAR